MNVIVNGEPPEIRPLARCNWLYNVAVGGRRGQGQRGVPAADRGAGGAFVLDVRFPLLFWNLRHGLEVYGGEPTDWYYAMQGEPYCQHHR